MRNFLLIVEFAPPGIAPSYHRLYWIRAESKEIAEKMADSYMDNGGFDTEPQETEVTICDLTQVWKDEEKVLERLGITGLIQPITAEEVVKQLE